MATLRSRLAPALNPYVMDLLIEGPGGPVREHDGADPFVEFDPGFDPAALYQQHRDLVDDEARRRGLAQPWIAAELEGKGEA